MHRNVAAHMDAHKRLMERLQAVFQHEQAMVLELAKVIDETTSQAVRQSNEDRPKLGSESMEQHLRARGQGDAGRSGKMLTDIQLEALALLKHYVDEAGEVTAKTAAEDRVSRVAGRAARGENSAKPRIKAGPLNLRRLVAG